LSAANEFKARRQAEDRPASGELRRAVSGALLLIASTALGTQISLPVFPKYFLTTFSSSAMDSWLAPLLIGMHYAHMPRGVGCGSPVPSCYGCRPAAVVNEQPILALDDAAFESSRSAIAGCRSRLPQ